jgi:TonB family protein
MEIVPEDSAAPARDLKGSAVAFPPKSPRQLKTEASNLDALVSEFLEELDNVSAALTNTPKSGAAPQADHTRKLENMDSGRSKRLPGNPRESSDFDLDEAEEFSADVDAELARTLSELEERPKSNVVPLILREPAKPQPQITAAAEILVAPESLMLTRTTPAPAVPAAPVEVAAPKMAQLEARAPDWETSDADDLAELGTKVRTILSTLFLTRRKLTITIAATALLAISAITYYYYYNSSPAKPGIQIQTPLNKESAVPRVAPEKTANGNNGNKGANAPDTTASGRRAGQQSPSPPPAGSSASSPGRRENSRVEPSVDAVTLNQAGSANPGESSVPPAKGRGDVPSGADATPQIPVNPATQSVAQGAPPAQAVTAPPTTPPQPQSQNSQPAATPKTTADGQASGADRIPAGYRPPALVPSAPPGNLSSPDLKANPAPKKSDAASIATPPVPVSRVNPEYPLVASRMAAKGRIDLAVEVDEEGKVTKARAISGPLVLRPAAEQALMKWRFKPATLRGVSVKSEVNVSVEFRQ